MKTCEEAVNALFGLLAERKDVQGARELMVELTGTASALEDLLEAQERVNESFEMLAESIGSATGCSYEKALKQLRFEHAKVLLRDIMRDRQA